jgi:hypothetical protein
MTVAGTAIVSAAIGTTVGYCLGAYAPGAYRSMFQDGADPRFDPVAVGLGLGCGQGLIAGTLIGLVVVVSVTWYEIRKMEFQAWTAAHQQRD